MRVGGRSMYPFLNTDYATSLSEDRVWVDLRPPSRKTARRESGLKRGEVVVFWSPSNPEHMAVKRIIALEGDIVETRRPYPFREETVPWGHVWVEGEHPEGERASVDSNNYGPIPVALVIGKVKAVYWPWKKAGWVRWQDWKGSSRVREGKTMEPIEMYTF
ncbi:MAG: hypothetical protein HETSPECPRED_006715 [Heterodermia speciosa]|uniref:Peptidase S26 domain-containing protein n=1 Tax=Heterodermia speciosa TaxID=116794 RepID=A0A8H3IU47_9LECA|nr:MAG: hypothetical protein HETSPECPRED_006715 [Heterodermia speciosa]